jgi:hypothetical protein
MDESAGREIESNSINEKRRKKIFRRFSFMELRRGIGGLPKAPSKERTSGVNWWIGELASWQIVFFKMY